MKSFIITLRIFFFFTLLTGIAYPLLVTGIARLMFPSKANGSIICKNGQPIGSLLIGQSFDSAGIYFTSRPSAIAYHPLPSGGSNEGLTNRKLKDQFKKRKEQFLRVNMLDVHTEIPSEMLFASASGLDPHISPEAAMLQAGRICRARNFSLSQEIRLKKMISQMTESPQFLCLGQKRINVLLLNLETDKIR